jgi:predicted nucleotidyltransferase
LKHQTVIKKIVNELKNKKYVEGILLFGSCARSLKSKHNDIDFFVLINENWRQRVSKYIDSILVELFFNPYEKYLDYFNNEDKMFTVQMFIDGKILFDRNGKLKELQKDAKKILPKRLKLSKDIINMIRYHVADANLDIQNELKLNKYQAIYLMDRTLEILLKYYFKITKIPEPKYNYIIKKVEKTNKKLYEKVKIFINEKNPEIKFKILKHIQNIVLKPIGEPKLTWTSSKEKLS